MDAMKTLLLALLACCARPAAALEAFTQAKFEALQGRNRTILVQFNAPRCAVCLHQEVFLGRILQDPVPWAPAVLQAAFDKDEEFKRRCQVTALGTLIVFRGKQEISRAEGLYTEEGIRSFIQDSLSKSRGRPKPRPATPFKPRP